jgi:hypothetical protein
MSALLRIDDALLSSATRFAHWFQRLTGRTSFFLAKLGLTAACISYVILLFKIMRSTSGSRPLAWMMTLIIILALISYAWTGIHLDEADAAIRSGDSVLPTPIARLRTTTSIQQRMGLLALGAFFLSVDILIAHTLRDFSTDLIFPELLAFDYFVLTDPLPPAPAKLREWLSIFIRKPAPA